MTGGPGHSIRPGVCELLCEERPLSWPSRNRFSLLATIQLLGYPPFRSLRGVTNRVGMNAAIDDVDFGIPRGAVLCLFVDLRSARSFRRLHRVASRSIVRRVSEQFEVAIFGLSVIGQPATAHGDRPGSEVRRAARGRPQGLARAMAVHYQAVQVPGSG